jgi:photosystem II stability/assembly factor-like uncharacterized protein
MPCLRYPARVPSVASALLALAASLAGPDARANGRFPRADQLVVVPGRADELVLRTTFGLLLSSDAGATWDWVCERAIGFSGIQDPALAILPNGVVLVGLLEGLAQSSDRGCSWSSASTPETQRPIVDLSARREAPSHAVALAWEQQPATALAPGYRARFLATSDGGQSWQAQGTGIDPSVLVLTLDLAPSDPHRLYASGIRSGTQRTAALFMSTDDGQSWSERPVPFDARTEQGLYIAAVDPISAERVYLRTSGASSSRLLVTADAGASFREPFAGGPMLGFALSLDGAEIFLGGVDDGLWVGARDELVFERRSTLPILCLARSADTLYACSNDGGGFALGASRDGGFTFEARLVLSEVRGPLQCAAGTSVDGACGADWAATSQRLGSQPMPGAGASMSSAPDASSSSVDPAVSPAATGGCSLDSAAEHGPRRERVHAAGLAALLGLALCMARRSTRAHARDPQSM